MVSQECSQSNKPASYQWCNQIECGTAGKKTQTQSKFHHESKYKRSAALKENYPPHRNSDSTLNIMSTQDFTIVVDGGHIFLSSHKGQKLLDLTDLTKITLTISESVLYWKGILSVSSGITIIEQLPDIEELLVYNGTVLQIVTPEYDRDIYLVTHHGQLFVSGKKALHSRNQQFNELLNKELLLISSKAEKVKNTPIELRSLLGGECLLAIGGTPIIIITNTQHRSILDRQFLQYFNNTLHIRDITEEKETAIFSDLDELIILNRLVKGTEKYKTLKEDIISGGGQLYIHMQTRKALYSKSFAVNRKIDDYFASQLLSFDPIVFSLHFNVYNLNREESSVAVSADELEVMRLQINHVMDWSVSLQHYIMYNSNTVYIQGGDQSLDIVKNIHKIIMYDGYKFITFDTMAPNEIPGGGQLFACQNIAFYSLDANLNDRIGDALLVMEYLP